MKPYQVHSKLGIGLDWIAGHFRRPDPGSLQSGLAALAQPFKLRLCRAPGAPPSLRDYSSNVVLIEPLATMAAIEVGCSLISLLTLC